MIPESSASPAYEYCCLSVKDNIYIAKCTTPGRLIVNGSVCVSDAVRVDYNVIGSSNIVVDSANTCNGNPCGWIGCIGNNGPSAGQLVFGWCSCSSAPRSGERIGSQRNCDTYCCGAFPPGKNLHGLDFYTDNKKRVSITNCGYVGIGVTSPKYPLEVNGDINALSGISATEMTSGACVWVDTSNYCNGNNTCGFPIWIHGEVAFGCGGERIGSQRNNITFPGCPTACPPVCYPPGKNLHGLDFYTNSQKRMSVTNSGKIGIGTCSPTSTLEVNGGGASCVPIVAKGASGQTAHLQEWQKSCGTAVAVMTKGGALGIGNNAPVTSLTVNGSVSYKVEIKSASYTMQAYDYAVLGSATSTAGITITLPAAKTALGFLAFIKKVDSNPHAVTVAASGTDTIENKGSTIALKKQYDSLQLMSNGTNEWFIMQSALCSVATS